jgi:hypothetical protein
LTEFRKATIQNKLKDTASVST